MTNPENDKKFDAGQNEMKRAMDSGEMNSGKNIIETVFNLSQGEITRLNQVLGQMKRNLGHWLISSDRNGGYAFAKLCSNGTVNAKVTKGQY